MKIPDYKKSPSAVTDYALAFILGFSAGFVIFYIFYKVLVLAILGAVVIGAVNMLASAHAAIKKRITRLRMQFFEMLEAMAVAMRAGNPIQSSLISAREDLILLYPQDSDIITELDIIVGKFNNAVPLSESFLDLAQRSGLEDIAGFAAIYATIEGKSGRADEIIRETQQIIADKMEIEMEIDTMMTAAKAEVNIMLFMPLVILGIIGWFGAGFMDAIYTTAAGRVVSTGGLIVFALSFMLARKYSNVKL